VVLENPQHDARVIGMIDPTKTTTEKLAEMNDSLIVDNNYLREQVQLLREENAKLWGWYNDIAQKGKHDT